MKSEEESEKVFTKLTEIGFFSKRIDEFKERCSMLVRSNEKINLNDSLINKELEKLKKENSQLTDLFHQKINELNAKIEEFATINRETAKANEEKEVRIT